MFLVDGGPTITSKFYPVGNVWTNAWASGAVADDPGRFAQAMKVAPGSCSVGEMELPLTERTKLVDHALSRVARNGLLTEIDVTGPENEEIYDPDFGGSNHEDPIYN